MFDDLKLIFDFLKPCLVVFLLLLIFATIIAILSMQTPAYKDYEKRHIEWRNKVNNCVMDMNSRPDCKLIIYKDEQNHNKNHSTVMPVVMPIVH